MGFISKSKMEKLGVKIIDNERSIRLECAVCGCVWSPNLLEGGRLPRGYWKCPEGCNKDVRIKGIP